MINSVSIENFKVMEKLENVQINKITLISGKNDTGKTTLLEALFLYLDYNNPMVLNKLYAWRDFTGIWGPKEVFGKFFSNSDLKKEIKILINSIETKKSELFIKFHDNFEAPAQFPITENGITTIRNSFPAFEIMHTSDEVIDYHSYILCYDLNQHYLKVKDSFQKKITVFYMGERMGLYKKNIEYLGELDKKDEQEKILPLLKVFEPNLNRLQLINENGNNIIYADLGNKRKIPVNLLGDGFCRCLTMALALVIKQTNVLLIDEVGAGIHYSVQNELWSFLSKAAELYNCQIIATTHSYDMIKAFNNKINSDNSSNYSYIRLGKSNNVIKSYFFTPDSLSYSLSSELEVR